MSSNIESGLTLEAQNVSADPAETSPHVPTLPFAFARRFGVVLDSRPNDSGAYEVAAKTQPRLSTLAEIRRITQHPTVIRIVAEDEFDQLLSAAYSQDSSEAKQMVEDLGGEMDLASLASALPKTEDLLDQADDAPIIRLINALLSEAIRENASDVHIETFDKALVVRFRVDGVMREVVRPRRELASLLVSRIKVMARLDIAEKRVPQDGRISLLLGGREVDVRVSTMPASAGERVVMRLLDKQVGRLQLQRLGLQTHTLEALQNVVHKPHGIFLVTGPTGSGKTTTLYAALAELDSTAINVLTVEDPIEYNLPGIGQTQVNNKADMTFARGLRAILRQDPDVVMVGEIRDLETAEIAVQSSLIREVQMWTDAKTLKESFSDFDQIASECQFHDCKHGSDQGCAIHAAIAAGTLCRERFINYLKLDFELEKLSQRRKKHQITIGRRNRRELKSKGEKYSKRNRDKRR